ncbi:uncharacterized protein LOC114752679 [Neltuma alba]|uniref:uncharacterized protein LOC114731926 n=1 Tax=Neltuma alba TaxID=207710 RepID=UPI0010A4467C|nr:uncharacterized protein LOC114731926 [Prosopis alba]XP_028797251.1 uncharacterized protein LOC114752679 [Prosopis alba]
MLMFLDSSFPSYIHTHTHVQETRLHHFYFIPHKHWISGLLAFLFSALSLLGKRHKMNRNEKRSEESCGCYLHPKQRVVGVCPLCLNEKLLILAEKQGLSASTRTKSQSTSSIQSIFPFRFLFSRPRSRDHYCHSSSSPEESFISIKFEGNGVASWEKNTASEVTMNNCDMSWNHASLMIPNKDSKKRVIEHGKSRDPLRWRKRIGHLFQVIRWKKSMNGHVEGVKMRKSWMRTLTKRKTADLK